MRVGIHTLGTRGDVEPYLALAAALQQAGHEALLVAPAQFAADAQQRAIPFASLPAEFLELLQDPEFAVLLAAGKMGWRSMRALLARYRPIMQAVLAAELAAADAFRPDVFVNHPKALGAPRIAAQRGRPSVLASPLPGFTPTSAFPSPVVPFRTLGPLNAVSHALTARAASLLFRRRLREWQVQAFGNEGKRGIRPDGTLYAYSAHVVPVPPEWRGQRVLVSGYWFLEPAGWSPDAGLRAFLEAGPAPVYVGFGSMPLPDPDGLTRAVLDALDSCGHRAVLAAGWGGLGRGTLPAHVHRLDQAPHSWLFPRMAAIVHHGGAGTTAAALRAGRPSVICPFFGDQPFWARRVAALGAGSEPLPMRAFSAAALAGRLRHAARPEMVRRSQELSARIQAERGLDEAVHFIERVAALRTVGSVSPGVD
jgi:sterol 3beta-glucosyltransferase